jgi:hypothetical protein
MLFTVQTYSDTEQIFWFRTSLQTSLQPYCLHLAAHGCEAFHMRQLALVIANHVTNEFAYSRPFCQITQYNVNA